MPSRARLTESLPRSGLLEPPVAADRRSLRSQRRLNRRVRCGKVSSGSLMNATFAVAVSLLLALKTIEMAFHTYTYATAVNGVRTWPITDVIQRLHLGHIFRLPLLVLAMAVLLAWCELPVWLSVTGAVLILGALWVQLIEALLSRLVFGYSDIAFRRVSVGVVPPAEPIVTDRRLALRNLALFLGAWVTTAIVGYAGVYAAINRLDSTAFTFSGQKGGPVDWLYFSVVTFATVGYGDILPSTPIARLLAISEIFVSMGSLVLLVLAYSLTGRDD